MSEIFPLFAPMPRKRTDSKFASKEQMLKAFETEVFKQAIADGEQEVFGKGRVLVRKSGTEPKIQVWVWSDEEDLAAALSQKISAPLRQCAGFDGAKNV